MSEDIIGAYQVSVNGPAEISTQKETRVRYEVWVDKTLVLRTIHEVQALRYAKEVEGEVRYVTAAGFTS